MATMKILKMTDRDLRILLFAGRNDVSEKIWGFLTERDEMPIRTFDETGGISTDLIASYNPDVIITCYWPFLLTPEMIKIPKYGCINFHPSLLPKNRGWYPSVWPFLDGTLPGVTLHMIDEGADTGDIIAQEAVIMNETDTGGDIYRKCQDAIIKLFKETWVKLRTDGVVLQPQDHAKATYHTKKEANALDEISLYGLYRADDLFNIIKAKTFGDKSYAYYMKNGTKYRLKLTITPDE
jgi:methionyl-tRNA formyltransferase